MFFDPYTTAWWTASMPSIFNFFLSETTNRQFQALVLPRTTILLLLFLTAFIWIAVILMLLLAVRLRLVLSWKWLISSRIVLRNVAVDKCRHSQVDQKPLYVLQVLSNRHWDKNTCSNTKELWWQNGTFSGFKDGLGLPYEFFYPRLHLTNLF